MIPKEQWDRVETLRSNPYEDASIYTILLDLVDNSNIEEVVTLLHNVAHNLDQVERMENRVEELKEWDWDN